MARPSLRCVGNGSSVTIVVHERWIPVSGIRGDTTAPPAGQPAAPAAPAASDPAAAARGQSAARPVLLRRWMLAAFPLLLMLLVACADDEGADDDSPVADTVTVTVHDDGIDPADMQLRVPDRVLLVVHNDSVTDCRFALGPFLRDLDVAPGMQSSLTVQIPAATEAGAEHEVGCDDGRTGTLRTLAPGGE